MAVLNRAGRCTAAHLLQIKTHMRAVQSTTHASIPARGAPVAGLGGRKVGRGIGALDHQQGLGVKVAQPVVLRGGRCACNSGHTIQKALLTTILRFCWSSLPPWRGAGTQGRTSRNTLLQHTLMRHSTKLHTTAPQSQTKGLEISDQRSAITNQVA